jgi:hypothetical protein
MMFGNFAEANLIRFVVLRQKRSSYPNRTPCNSTPPGGGVENFYINPPLSWIKRAFRQPKKEKAFTDPGC